MDNKIEATVYQWLQLMNVAIEKKYLVRRLKSHPDYPSALSITSLLDDLGIENCVAQIEKNQLNEVPTPFLAFVDGKDFSIVTDVQNLQNSFTDRWNGVVVFVEKGSTITPSPEIKKSIALARNLQLKRLITISILTFLLGNAFFELPGITASLLVVAIVGLIISASIVLRELGINTTLSQRLCGGGENTGCDAILHTKASMLFWGIKLSDLCVSFFTGIILLAFMNSFSAQNFQNASVFVRQVVCLASIPFTLFSIYYQWQVVKKWCTSCLLVAASLWLMAAIQLPYQFEVKNTRVMDLVVALSVFILPTAVWLLLRRLLDHEQNLENSNIVLQRTHRSPELFETYLRSHKKVDITPWSFDFQIGNRLAPCQLLVVSSYLCGPCAETHELLQALLKKHKDQFGITIRFLINNTNSSKAKIMEHMLQYSLPIDNYLQNPERVEHMISTWYGLMDLEKFGEQFPVTQKINVDQELKQICNWPKSLNIKFTPTVFINGYELRHPYSQNDLLEFSSALLEIFSNEEAEHEVYA